MQTFAPISNFRLIAEVELCKYSFDPALFRIFRRNFHGIPPDLLGGDASTLTECGGYIQNHSKSRIVLEFQKTSKKSE